MNKQPWESESDISAEYALQCIRKHCPAIRADSIRELGKGWDNTAFLVNDLYVFRFPRRTIGIECIRHEISVLTHLKLESTRISIPEFIGTFDLDGEPCPFAGYQIIEGQLASEQRLSYDERLCFARPLGEFLSELHNTPQQSVAYREAPRDLIGRMDLTRRIPQTYDRLKQISELNLTPHSAALSELIDSLASRLEMNDELVLSHGDLYSRHIVTAPDLSLAGIIDWGDVHVNHPAVDLAVSWKFLPVACHSEFQDAYGHIPNATWDLAKFRALNHLTALLVYAHDTQAADLIVETQFTIENLISDM